MYFSFCSIIIQPDQISFVPIDEETDLDLSSVLESAQQFRLTINVLNNGPSRSPFSMLTIFWPLVDPLQTNKYFLYPLTIDSVSMCIDTYILMQCVYLHRINL